MNKDIFIEVASDKFSAENRARLIAHLKNNISKQISVHFVDSRHMISEEIKNKEIEIPEGYEARIEGNKVIIERKESEDERMLNAIIGGLGCIQKAGCERFGGEEMSDVILWIKTVSKSLRPQPYWKPSEYQMKALYSLVFDGGITYVSQLSYLKSLYEDLKNL